MYRRGRPFVFESGKGCGWGGLANFVLADFQHGQEHCSLYCCRDSSLAWAWPEIYLQVYQGQGMNTYFQR